MIVVIGKSGQLACELKKLQCDFIFLGRDDINLFDQAALNNTLSNLNPTAIINAAAYTAVDKAETDSQSAYALNAEAVKYLASYCKVNNCYLVHISTDYVFQGDKGSPYLENHPLSPLGVYGASKARGEEYIQEILGRDACIIRTSWVYSCFGNNFVKTMLNLMASKDSLSVVGDQIGTPTWAKNLAQAAVFAAQNQVKGVFHWTDLGVASWYDFAVAIQELAVEKGLLSNFIPLNSINSKEYPTPAKRPHYSVLDKTHTIETFTGVDNAHWRYQLSAMLDELKD